jgi:hypothetical protein
MKKLFVVLILFISSMAYSQFIPARHYLGPSIGWGFKNSSLTHTSFGIIRQGNNILKSSSPTFGLNYEYARDNHWTFGSILRYQNYEYQYNFEYPDYGIIPWSDAYICIDIGVQGNYHIKGLIDDKKWDPFVGLVLGYNLVWSGEGTYFLREDSGIFFTGHATMRYWLNRDLGIQARLGFVGFGNVETSLEIGVDFKF